ncbi:hypothetical protein BS50DRAFT_237455 [Corynespora cassiicola Philippines]|uniref:Uncharacterized protein n=1 Tax=Corynespora cassiicola Philippines TaxID=1448308 RepID=A0A2T2P2I6_CORCC|nr:hypothetical protein BS50DRAFT_237455 [Corynespora cassiicola Philippines]
MMGFRSWPLRRFLPPLPLAAWATCFALLMAAFLMSVPFIMTSPPRARWAATTTTSGGGAMRSGAGDASGCAHGRASRSWGGQGAVAGGSSSSSRRGASVVEAVCDAAGCDALRCAASQLCWLRAAGCGLLVLAMGLSARPGRAGGRAGWLVPARSLGWADSQCGWKRERRGRGWIWGCEWAGGRCVLCFFAASAGGWATGGGGGGGGDDAVRARARGARICRAEGTGDGQGLRSALGTVRGGKRARQQHRKTEEMMQHARHETATCRPGFFASASTCSGLLNHPVTTQSWNNVIPAAQLPR